MNLLSRWFQGLRNYVGYFNRFNQNVRLLMLTSCLSGIGYGIFSVDFNLYILSLGFNPADLGRVLSMGPFAQILSAIPIGFVAEKMGYRRIYVAIFAIIGLMQFTQAAVVQLPWIAGAAFISGLAASGGFVVKLPFLNANTSDAERTHAFSMDSLLQGVFTALGALIAGYLPNLLTFLSADPSARYRYTLFFAAALTFLGLLPALLMRDTQRSTTVKISLKPYLWGMDLFTAKGAAIEFFIGLTMGLIVPFMNLYFIYHLGTTREFFSMVEALVWIPTSIALALLPIVALRRGVAESITMGRFLIPIFPLVLAFTGLPTLGALAYWAYRGLFSSTQSIWFSLAMATSQPKSRTALSAWLEITFQVGMAIAALLTGSYLARGNYTMPFVLSAGAALMTASLTHWFISVPLRRARASQKQIHPAE